MMAKSQELANFEQMLEKIIFKDEELEELKIAIKNFTERKTSAKELKQLLLQCRSRMTEEVAFFISLFVKKKTQTSGQSQLSKENLPSPTEVELQLRNEIKEKNDLLETVAIRVNNLVSKLSNDNSEEEKKPNTIEGVKEEIDRCLTQIGAEQWIKMSYYDDYKFFVKLYPKLEALYKERFGESEKNSSEGKEIMANKIVKLGFPEEIETLVIKYIAIRNKFHHSMDDILPSHLELAREVFVNVFLYLIVSNLKIEFLSRDRESLYEELANFFSKRLTGNPIFRKEIARQLKMVL